MGVGVIKIFEGFTIWGRSQDSHKALSLRGRGGDVNSFPKKYFTMFDKSLAFDVYYMKETEGRIAKERIIAL